MSERQADRVRYERTAVAHEIVILLLYAQMIEILAAHPPYVMRLGGPFSFVLACSLAILCLLYPVPSIVRGKRWAYFLSWGLAVLCFIDGLFFLLNSATGWLSSMGVMVAGLFLTDRLLRSGDLKHVFQKQASSRSTVS